MTTAVFRLALAAHRLMAVRDCAVPILTHQARSSDRSRVQQKKDEADRRGHHACDDGRVIIGQQLRDYVHGHASIPQRGVPRAVVEAIATFVADAKIKAAWPDWDSTDSTTTWTCWIVTPEALGYVRVEYGMPLYDEHADREHKLTPSSQSAWSRPLTDVIQLRWGAVHEAPAQHDTYYPAEPITVTFSEGETTIPEGDFPVGQRAKADQVLAAIRAGVNFGNLYNSRRE